MTEKSTAPLRQFCAYEGADQSGPDSVCHLLVNGIPCPDHPDDDGRRCKAFTCTTCGASVGWCTGGDDWPGEATCSDCWNEANGVDDAACGVVGPLVGGAA